MGHSVCRWQPSCCIPSFKQSTIGGAAFPRSEMRWLTVIIGRLIPASTEDFPGILLLRAGIRIRKILQTLIPV